MFLGGLGFKELFAIKLQGIIEKSICIAVSDA